MEHDLKLLVSLYEPLKEYGLYGCHTTTLRRIQCWYSRLPMIRLNTQVFLRSQLIHSCVSGYHESRMWLPRA